MLGRYASDSAMVSNEVFKVCENHRADTYSTNAPAPLLHVETHGAWLLLFDW